MEKSRWLFKSAKRLLTKDDKNLSILQDGLRLDRSKQPVSMGSIFFVTFFEIEHCDWLANGCGSTENAQIFDFKRCRGLVAIMTGQIDTAGVSGHVDIFDLMQEQV